jgi:hypothetical protein
MFEFLRANTEYIFRLVAEIPLLFFKPRAFLALLNSESGPETVKRLFFMTALYYLLITSLFSVFDPENLQLNYFQLIGLGFLEVVIAMYYLLPLLVSRLFFEAKVGARQIIVFAVTSKYALTIFPIICYLLFLQFENYVFAVIRALLLLCYVLFTLTILPVICTSRVSRRALSIAATFVSLFALAAGVATIATSYNLDPSLIKKLMLQYDPIGKESLTYLSKADPADSLTSMDDYAQRLIASVSVRRQGDSLYIFSMSSAKLNDFTVEWTSRSANFRQSIASIRVLIDSTRSSLRYKTPKRLVALADSDIVLQQNLFTMLDQTITTGKLRNVAAIAFVLSPALEKRLLFMEFRNEIVRNLNTLRRYLVIII